MFDTTQFIVDWSNRMTKKERKWCGCVVTEALANFMGEEGNEQPSENACYKAIEWEKDETEMINHIKKVGRWCAAPTLGCRRFCSVWEDTIWGNNKSIP